MKPRAFVSALLTGLLLPLAAGCSAFTTFSSTPGPRPSVRPLPVPGTDLFDYKGVVHCHSYLSHDSDGTVAEIAAACRVANVDFVCMTDHQTDESIAAGVRGMVGDTLFLVGCEHRSPQGTVLAVGLSQPLRRWQHAGLLAKDTVAQGGVAFVGHAEAWRDFDLPDMTGIEIVNLHAAAKTRGKVGTVVTGLLMSMEQLMRRLCWRDDAVLAAWDRQLARRHPFTPVGGNDAHANVRVFGPLGGTLGTYQEVFLTLSTHVLATELCEAAVLDALRHGRTYVAFDVFGEGAGFDFRALDQSGVHVVGSTVQSSPELQLCIAVPAPGQIDVFCDGEVVQRATGSSLTVPSPAPGVWRVEVRTDAGRPWLFSSSIKVTAAP